jgi:hypothetical protein
MNAHDETALDLYQQNRHLDREKMAKLLDRFFAPPPISPAEYEAVLRDVRTEMAHV